MIRDFNIHAFGRRAAALLAIALALGAVGCTRYHDVTAFAVEPHPETVAKPYHVAPPDVLNISSVVVSEMGNATVPVNPDGTIMLPLFGSVHVAGKTIDEIATLLEERAAEFYSDPDITVNVQNYRSKHVYVFGEVRAPGRYPYTGSSTILSLLAAAQPSRTADQKRIQVLRPHGNGEGVDRMTIDLGRWVKRGVTDRNALLEEGDIVYIPPNGFAEVGYAMQNLLRPVSPAAQTVNGVTDVDNDSSQLRQ